METTKCAGRGGFQRRRARQSRSSLLCLPTELRNRIYSEVFQPRIYQSSEVSNTSEVDHPGCRPPISIRCLHVKDCQIRQHRRERANLSAREGYHAYHHNCGCSQRGTVRILRVCQQIYVEAQPYLLFNSTLAFQRAIHLSPLERDASIVPATGQNVTVQLEAFYQKYLYSSLSGLKPITQLRTYSTSNSPNGV
jgi:hypothetical protein